MKRLSIAIISVLLSVAPLSAQIETRSGALRPANEISVSYGLVTIPQISNTLAAIFGTAFTGGAASVEEINSAGSFALGYLRYLNPHIAIGATLAYESTELVFATGSGLTENRNQFLSVLPSVKIPWFYRQHFSMYSKAAAGVVLMDNSEDGAESSAFGFQAVLMGFDFGGKSCRGFIDLGLGMHGLLSGGLCFSF